jgi:hemoglobin
MQETQVDPVLRERLNASFLKTADWMRNQGG